jgi:uncharacterized protein YlxP (DUF503 family)
LVGVLTIHLHLPACSSLKEKRRRLKPLLNRLHRQFNVAVAEMARQDSWQEAIVSCATVGNDNAYLQSALSSVEAWVKGNWPDGMIVDSHIELI